MEHPDPNVHDREVVLCEQIAQMAGVWLLESRSAAFLRPEPKIASKTPQLSGQAEGLAVYPSCVGTWAKVVLLFRLGLA